jgi:predicted O-methyltransferase YrrM
MSLRLYFSHLFQAARYLPASLSFISKHGTRSFAVPTQLTKTERVLLYTLAAQLSHEATLVEIGSWFGGSAQFLAAAASQRNGTLYCVDTWMGDAMTSPSYDSHTEFLANVRRFGPIVKPLRGTSDEMAKQFKSKIDFLFIDGDHSYDGCRLDIEAWFPHLEREAIVVFHDYGWAEGVQRAVKELVLPIQLTPGRRLHSLYWTNASASQHPVRG